MVWVGFTPDGHEAGVFSNAKGAVLRNLEEAGGLSPFAWVHGYVLDGRITDDDVLVGLPRNRAEAEVKLAVVQSDLEDCRTAFERAAARVSRAQAVVDAMAEYETGHANG